MPARAIGRTTTLLAAGALAALVALAGAGGAAAGPPRVQRDGAGAYIADGQGRELLLRGVNVNALVQYRADYHENVPVGRDDFREMAALGFSWVRLAISWSRIEPAPGRIDRAYVDQVARTVRAAEREGILVLVDMHQDRYNRRLMPGDESDGAPDWATRTDGLPCRPQERSSLCAQAAYQHFWDDDVVAGKPLQAHYLDALRAVSRRLRGDSRLLGFELMNEPTFGFVAPPAFERTELYPFYVRLIAGLRADGERRMLWFEPNILRDVTDFDSGVALRFSSDADLVYAPHLYTETFSPPFEPTGSREHLEASYRTAELEALAFGAPLIDGEWGGGEDAAWTRWRRDQLDLQDQYRVGSAFWIWKQRPGFYGWTTVEIDGALRRDSVRAQQLSRPHLTAAPGRLDATALVAGRLTARLHGPGGVAELWSGTVVRRGGRTLLHAALRRTRVDGRDVCPTLRARRYVTARVSLLGYRVSLRVRRGAHTIELLAGSPRGCPARHRRASDHRRHGRTPRFTG